MLFFKFFDLSSLGLLSSLLRFYIFFTRVVWAELHSTEFELSAKRILILLVLFLVLPSLIVWNHIGFFFDDIFFPDWRHQSTGEPLFIVGNARSGTTWLHRLIALDEDTFTSFKTWEIIFGVSVTWRMLIIDIYCLDKLLLLGLFTNVLSSVEKYLVGGVTIHPVGLQLAEEDEWIMAHVFLSQLIMLFFPLGGAVLNPLVYFDKEEESNLPLIIRRQIFVYYKQSVQRHLYARQNPSYLSRRALINRNKNSSSSNIGRNDNTKIFLSKNPPFTMRLELLYKTFPDCRVVCLLRDPLQSVPSMISYISQVGWFCVDSFHDKLQANNLFLSRI
jgi:hypothetical protein